MDFTIAIPVYNSIRTISTTLDYLCLQDITGLNIIIADNGSNDGTYEMLEAQLKNGYWHNRGRFNIILMQFGRVEGGKEKNIPHMRRMLSQVIKTPYVFWLDSDVLLSANSLEKLFNDFKKVQKTVGLFGIRYTPKADHVQMGASFMKTDVAKKMKWKWEEHMCDCKNVRVQLGKDFKLGTDYHEELQARHYPKII